MKQDNSELRKCANCNKTIKGLAYEGRYIQAEDCEYVGLFCSEKCKEEKFKKFEEKIHPGLLKAKEEFEKELNFLNKYEKTEIHKNFKEIQIIIQRHLENIPYYQRPSAEEIEALKKKIELSRKDLFLIYKLLLNFEDEVKECDERRKFNENFIKDLGVLLKT